MMDVAWENARIATLGIMAAVLQAGDRAAGEELDTDEDYAFAALQLLEALPQVEEEIEAGVFAVKQEEEELEGNGPAAAAAVGDASGDGDEFPKNAVHPDGT